MHTFSVADSIDMHKGTNTTGGHSVHETVWYSDNWKWSIERRATYKRNGDLASQHFHIYDQASGIMWPINHETKDNEFYPKYVRRAISRHVPSEA